ncbi:hypothetical protein [Calidifontibacillus oryziterrae]|uniref:hypothetical protein n=1 Tax=Calidifontibacillus oryziterrae TaxID=1191699 RepID=UPI00030CF419|nr:hypothetical protein [Calidifontibacillus oryziterrae]
MFEITGKFSKILPLIIVVVLSFHISSVVLAKSIDISFNITKMEELEQDWSQEGFGDIKAILDNLEYDGANITKNRSLDDWELYGDYSTVPLSFWKENSNKEVVRFQEKNNLVDASVYQWAANINVLSTLMISLYEGDYAPFGEDITQNSVPLVYISNQGNNVLDVVGKPQYVTQQHYLELQRLLLEFQGNIPRYKKELNDAQEYLEWLDSLDGMDWANRNIKRKEVSDPNVGEIRISGNPIVPEIEKEKINLSLMIIKDTNKYLDRVNNYSLSENWLKYVRDVQNSGSNVTSDFVFEFLKNNGIYESESQIADKDQTVNNNDISINEDINKDKFIENKQDGTDANGVGLSVALTLVGTAAGIGYSRRRSIRKLKKLVEDHEKKEKEKDVSSLRKTSENASFLASHTAVEEVANARIYEVEELGEKYKVDVTDKLKKLSKYKKAGKLLGNGAIAITAVIGFVDILAVETNPSLTEGEKAIKERQIFRKTVISAGAGIVGGVVGGILFGPGGAVLGSVAFSYGADYVTANLDKIDSFNPFKKLF